MHSLWHSLETLQVLPPSVVFKKQYLLTFCGPAKIHSPPRATHSDSVFGSIGFTADGSGDLVAHDSRPITEAEINT
jgi:hypothetical protein